MIRELDDDQAVVAMVDSNLHRENLKPSEKAFAYKMKLDAMKHQGKRLPEVSSVDDGEEVLVDNEVNNVTSAQVGPKCDTDGNGRADNLENESNEVIEEHSMINNNELLARQVGESVAQIKRYIRLTNLIPKILAMVDEGTLAGMYMMQQQAMLTAGLQNAGMPMMNFTAGAMNTNMTGAGEQNGGCSRENGVAQGQNAGISRQETLTDDEPEDNEFLDFSFGM